MERIERRSAASEGVAAGFLAGIVFAIAEIIAAGARGSPPLTPTRMFASVVFGRDALSSMSLGLAFVLGMIVHLTLSAIFGAVYGALNSPASDRVRRSYAAQAVLGLGFGLLLWVLNFQLVARVTYPWFLRAPQGLHALMHALFYGLPLGLMFAAAEHHVQIAAPTRVPH